jgi:hypothetical protein
LIKIGAKKLDENGKIKYKVRFMEVKISRLAEALVLYSLTLGN